MPFNYEALVGYLYVVGGRAVSVSPPGALVEVAPKRAARGRETDTYFALVLPSGDSIAPTAFYEQMVRLSAERYFDSTGSVSAGLRDMLVSINQNLLDHNQSEKNRTYEANLICAVLRGEDLIIARAGSGVILLLHEGEVQTLPPDLANDEALFGPPLGVHPTPEVKLSRHRVTTGTRLLLADHNLADLKREQFERAIKLPEIGDVLVGFKELARLQLTMVAVEFVPPEVPTPMPVPEGESTVAIAEAARVVAKTRTAEVAAVPGVAIIGDESPRGARRTTAQIAQTAQQGLGTAANGLAQGMAVTGKTIEHFFGPPPVGKRRWYASPIATAVAILTPIVIVGVVVLLWLGGTGQTEYEMCREVAEELAGQADRQGSGSAENAVTLWSAVIDKATQCEQLRPGDEVSIALIRRGQGVIDLINSVERREAIRLDSVEDAAFSQIITQGQSLYVLDKTNRKRVYQASLSEDGLSLTRQLNPITDMTTGANVRGIPIVDLIGIAYAQERDSLLALDKNGSLVICSRAQMQSCDVQYLRDVERWVNPVAIKYWQNRLYILDPGANQIWRYDSINGAFSGVPGEYFAGQNIGRVNTAVDFAIQAPPSGGIFVLLADGTILSYLGGEPQEFRYGGIPEGQPINSAQAMVLDEGPTVRGFFIANRAGAVIHEVALGGTFRNGYKVFDESLFATLSGVASNPLREVLYATSGNSVFAIKRTK